MLINRTFLGLSLLVQNIIYMTARNWEQNLKMKAPW